MLCRYMHKLTREGERMREEVEDVEDVAETGRGRSDVERSGGVRDGGTGGGGISRESAAWWRQTRVSKHTAFQRKTTHRSKIHP